MASEAEPVLQGPDDCLDPLQQPVREGPGDLLAPAGRPDQYQAQVRAGEEVFGLFAGQAPAGDDGGAGRRAVGGLIPERLPGISRSPGSAGLARPPALRPVQ